MRQIEGLSPDAQLGCWQGCRREFTQLIQVSPDGIAGVVKLMDSLLPGALNYRDYYENAFLKEDGPDPRVATVKHLMSHMMPLVQDPTAGRILSPLRSRLHFAAVEQFREQYLWRMCRFDAEMKKLQPVQEPTPFDQLEEYLRERQQRPQAAGR